MKKRLFITVILGLAFTPSAYASCHMDFNLSDAHCVSDDDTPSASLTVQPDTVSNDDTCPLLQAYAGESSKSGGWSVDGDGGGGRHSAGIAGD